MIEDNKGFGLWSPILDPSFRKWMNLSPLEEEDDEDLDEEEHKLAEKGEALSGCTDPFLVSAAADFVFSMIEEDAKTSSAFEAWFGKARDDDPIKNMTTELMAKAACAFETLTFGLVRFPIPPRLAKEVCGFVAKYALISRYFAYGDPNASNDVEKQDVLRYLRCCNNVFDDCLQLWEHAFRASGSGLIAVFNLKTITDPNRQLNPRALSDIGRVVGADVLVKALIESGIPVEDLCMEEPRRRERHWRGLEDSDIERDFSAPIPQMPKMLRQRFEAEGEIGLSDQGSDDLR